MGYSVALTFGIILFIIALAFFRDSLTFLNTSERANAVVIDLDYSQGESYTPIFKFITKTNKEIILPISSNNWKIGEEVIIAYDPNNPSTVRLLTYYDTFKTTINLLSLAMPLLVIGGGYHLSQYFLK